MAAQDREYPKMMYHRRLAPKGQVFQSAEQAVGLAEAGWVDTPAKFPKRSELSLAELKEDFQHAEEQYRLWTASGACEPGSVRWEEAVAAYNSARDSYEFAMREAELHSRQAPANSPARQRSSTRLPSSFDTAFGAFKVTNRLGEGGNGVVLGVVDEHGHEWALKCLKADAALDGQKRKRFTNEMRFGAEHAHPNIIAIRHYGLTHYSDLQVPFYIMPRFPTTLRKLMQARIAPRDVLPWFEQILSGLEAAHGLGVWHRDLKPENLLCDPATGRLVITDFGMAHFVEPLLQTAVQTSAHERIANFHYSAPEQRARGEINDRADVYALGLILNEMFTGEIRQGAGARTIQSAAPEFGYLDAAIERMVQQSPAQRPAIAEIRGMLLLRPLGSAGGPAAATDGGNTHQLADISPPNASIYQRADSRDPGGELFERLKFRILATADQRHPEPAIIDVHQLGIQFELNVHFVHELLEDLETDRVIALSKWDGTRVRRFEEWSSPDVFWTDRNDSGNVRVTLRRRGKEQLISLNARRKNAAT